MRVGTFFGFAHRFGQFHLDAAMLLDLLVGELDGIEHLCFRHFVHLTFHHHDVVEGGPYHDVDIGFFQFLEGGVDHIFPVDAGYTYFRDGSVEGYIGYGQCSGGCETGQCIGHIVAVGGEENHIHKHIGVVIVGEEGTQGAVDEPASQYFRVGGSAFSFQESAWKASCGGKFPPVFHL